MNKTFLIVILIVLLGLGVAGISYLNSSKTKNSQEAQVGVLESDTTPVADTDSGMMKATLMDLVKLGKDYQCTYDYTDESENRLLGKVYIANAGKKMNGDFTMMQPDGTEVKSNVINDGEYMYIWSSDLAQGFKSKVTVDDENLFGSTDKSTTDNSTTTPPTDLTMNFDCDPWTVNNAMFVPPANIEFADFSAQFESMMENKCSACEQLSGDSKAQCLTRKREATVFRPWR